MRQKIGPIGNGQTHFQEQVNIALEGGDGTMTIEKETTVRRRMSTTHRFEKLTQLDFTSKLHLIHCFPCKGSCHFKRVSQ